MVQKYSNFSFRYFVDTANKITFLAHRAKRMKMIVPILQKSENVLSKVTLDPLIFKVGASIYDEGSSMNDVTE